MKRIMMLSAILMAGAFLPWCASVRILGARDGTFQVSRWHRLHSRGMHRTGRGDS